MILVVDHVFSDAGEKVGEVFIDTSNPQVRDTLHRLATGELDHVQSGWGEMTKHPDHPGKTRFEVAQAEAERLDDHMALEAMHIKKGRQDEPRFKRSPHGGH